MSLTGTLLLALQVSASAGVSRDSARASVSIGLPTLKRIAVTDEMRRTAFKDTAARALLLRARMSRTEQDSALMSYEAKGYQRISVGMSLRQTARERLVFRMESASRVRWHRSGGARVEMLGARSVAPILQGIKDAEEEMRNDSDLSEIFSIPYWPGKDELWMTELIGGGDDDDDDGEMLIHPIADGSEAYFTFETGESVSMTLPDGKRIAIRELRVVPREARWNLVVGSLWFDVEQANVVRVVLRFSAPMDISAVAEADDPEWNDDVPFIIRGLLNDMSADMGALTIEYGLYNQRFWLPRLQGADFWAKVGFMRVPVRIEQRYRYESVNATEPFPPVDVAPRRTWSIVRDSLIAAGLDSTARRPLMREYFRTADSIATVKRDSTCAARSTYTSYDPSYGSSKLPVAIEVPCDRSLLENSPELPRSIYDAGEELFGAREREELADMLGFGLQPAWSPQKPILKYGLGHTRYNRVEGLSTGVTMESTLGRGFTTSLTARGSLADAQLNGAFSLARSNGRTIIEGTAYRRLSESSDFGDPLTFGASVVTLVTARDEGFYHRSWGGELTGRRAMGSGIEWRLFAEQQRTAAVESRWTLFRGANDSRYVANVVADPVTLYGANLNWRGSRGLDPAGWRLSTDLRLEGATGDAQYGRAFLEAGVSRGLGAAAASLTAAVGTTVGDLPAQRHFFLGGLHSVRGQTAGTGVGESFWLGRLEVGTNVAAMRPVVFGDLGWAGPRSSWGQAERPMAGVGTGVSFLDGMIRVDLARGMHPRWQTRLDFYFEARF